MSVPPEVAPAIHAAHVHAAAARSTLLPPRRWVGFDEGAPDGLPVDLDVLLVEPDRAAVGRVVVLGVDELQCLAALALGLTFGLIPRLGFLFLRERPEGAGAAEPVGRAAVGCAALGAARVLGGVSDDEDGAAVALCPTCPTRR